MDTGVYSFRGGPTLRVRRRKDPEIGGAVAITIEVDGATVRWNGAEGSWQGPEGPRAGEILEAVLSPLRKTYGEPVFEAERASEAAAAVR